jgi:hypothetical protein
MKVVPIEGGLGAQIFGVMLYEYLRRSNEDVRCDITYFSRLPKIANPGEGISIFPWELDYYNLSKSMYLNPPPKINLIRKKLKFFSPNFLIDGSRQRFDLLLSAWKNDWADFFPIKREHAEEASRLVSGGSPTVVVHLRRGDYLNVASHVVSDENVMAVIRKVSHLGIRRVLFVSDSEVPIDYFKSNLPEINEWEVLVSKDIFLTHAVMRVSKFLITSNSQFSLSAALLNRQAVVFMPKKWFSDQKKVIFRSFRSKYTNYQNDKMSELFSWGLMDYE